MSEPGLAFAALVDGVRRAPVAVACDREDAATFLRRAERGDAGADHLTVIAWVFDAERRRLVLVDHRLHGWSCPGGHIEADESAVQTARRELFEETGLRAFPVSTDPFSVTTSVGCARASADVRHWTLGYRFVVPSDAALSGEPDQPARWFAFDQLPEQRASDIDAAVTHVRAEGSTGSAAGRPEPT